MNKKSILSIVVGVLILSSIMVAKEEKSQKIELPELTKEYKLNRSIINIVGLMIGGIAYAKSKGEKPEDFAPYCTYLIAGSYWKDEDFSYYAKKWHRIFSTDENFKMEIVNETEDEIDLKMNIFGERYIASYAESGVTKEEYIRYLGAMLSSMAEFMDFEYKQKLGAIGSI